MVTWIRLGLSYLHVGLVFDQLFGSAVKEADVGIGTKNSLKKTEIFLKSLEELQKLWKYH
jgi:hypothetical protein